MLINTIAEIREFNTAINPETAFDTIAPYINAIENDVIKKYLTESFYETLNTYVENDCEPEDATLDALLPYIRRPLANLALLKWFPLSSVKLGDMGAHREENETRLSTYKYQDVAFLEELRNEGYNSMDNLLSYLETNKSLFTVWKAGYLDVKPTFFINKTSEFNDLYFINNSRLIYNRLEKYFPIVENTLIVANIGRAWFDQLKTQIKAGTLTVANTTAVDYIKYILAFETAAVYAERAQAQITDKGFFFETIEAYDKNIAKTNIATREMLQTIITADRATAISYMNMLRDYLNANISSYPLYAASGAYNSGATVQIDKAKKIVFF